MKRFVLGLDEGTTSARSVLFDVDEMKVVDIEGVGFRQYYPQKNWVEQDAEEIFRIIKKTSKAVLDRNLKPGDELLGIGITNQRETVVAWDRESGKPIYHAIVWQCRRTSKEIEKLSPEIVKKIKDKTGLIANSYFSASKMKWILDNVKEARILAKQKRLCFGTIDSFLAFKLTGNFVTDTTNACRTMLFNIHTLAWDDELLKLFGITKDMLPEVCSCDANFGKTKILGAPICAMIGDQMSSMVGQGVLNRGDAKVTYGTGGFVMCNTGEKIENTQNLLTTVAGTFGEKTTYAIEGSIYSACSAINWIQSLELFNHPPETYDMATAVKDNGGVYFVPAFTGLGAPYWNDDAHASFTGISFDTTKNHLVRATLESMAYNTKAIFDELKNQKFKTISVDGGASNNDFVLQFLADILQKEVVKSKESEATVLGAIFVAMKSLGILNFEDLKKITKSDVVFKPKMSKVEQKKFYDGWKKAIEKL